MFRFSHICGAYIVAFVMAVAGVYFFHRWFDFEQAAHYMMLMGIMLGIVFLALMALGPKHPFAQWMENFTVSLCFTSVGLGLLMMSLLSSRDGTICSVLLALAVSGTLTGAIKSEDLSPQDSFPIFGSLALLLLGGIWGLVQVTHGIVVAGVILAALSLVPAWFLASRDEKTAPPIDFNTGFGTPMAPMEPSADYKPGDIVDKRV